VFAVSSPQRRAARARAASNVYDEAARTLDDDELWRAGKLHVLSGRDRSVLLEIDGDDLVPVRR
jgi:hypothetical protein